ncbi:MAG: anti-sigma factor antagonist [Phycisphaerales bacterium]|nr:anti-sigma factor antagonist [Phycisphaerales bacterium]
MPLSDWSDNVILGEMADEPALREDLDAIFARIEKADRSFHIVLDMRAVTYLNSSNIAQLLQLRKGVIANDGSLHLCGVRDSVWSVLLMTGLDRLFKFTDDVPTALAAAQLGL